MRIRVLSCNVNKYISENCVATPTLDLNSFEIVYKINYISIYTAWFNKLKQNQLKDF